MISKLPHVGTTIFTVMSKMAADHQAINLAQGFPNFPVDPKLIAILQKNLNENYHQYAPMAGSSVLIDKLCALTEEQYQRKTSSTEILVTAGATQGIFTIIQALVHEGEEVIVIDPAYDCYDPAIFLTGAKAIHVPMEADFTVDWNKIADAITDKTKILIINNPHNPSGRVLSKQDLDAIGILLQKYPKLILLSDEVYEYIHFESPHYSAHQLTDYRDRIIVVSSFGKTFHITGWKMGYLIAPEKLMVELKKVHQFLVFSVNHFAQHSLAEYLEVIKVSELGLFYQQKRDYFRSLLKNSRFELLPCEGTYFQTVNYEQLSSKNDMDYAKELVEKHGVAAIPMSAFYAKSPEQNLLRFCFAKDDETLEKAAYNLCKI